MKTYRRIPVAIIAGGQSDILLRGAAELAQVQRAQMPEVHVLDARS